MKGRYRQSVVNSRTHFTHAPQGVLEFSRMHSPCKTETTGNAGDIIPLRAIEVLPNSTFSINADFDIRQATALVPSMDNMIVDIYAFFVPNRVVNKSWKSVQGENQSGQWVAPEVSLAPLCGQIDADIYYDVGGIQVPPGSVADYYGYPTQSPIPINVLQQNHDLLFRGYLEIYNNYFRNQNYQPPIPYSKLNVYNGFMLPNDPSIEFTFSGEDASGLDIPSGQKADNSYPNGAVVNALYGSGGSTLNDLSILANQSTFRALAKPLKANKLHDYFTSVLPSPQKGREVVVSTLGTAPIYAGTEDFEQQNGMRYQLIDGAPLSPLLGLGAGGTFNTVTANGGEPYTIKEVEFAPKNLYADLTNASTFTLNDMRMSAAIQQVYEILGTSGSRYVEFVNSFFGLEVENPFDDIPTLLGHCRRNLDLYQVAQTSQGEGSSVGSLGAFGYTSDGGKLFDKTFLEHGYVHILGVIRHRNVYSSTMSRDKFRMSQLDFYLYPLANIGEQPVYTREINPFASGEDGKNVFGYQEAWSEYRFEPDIVTGLMRPGAEENLSVWNYADYFENNLQFADGEFMKSNSAEVLNRSIAIADSEQPQFKIKVVFDIVKQLPMPTYSMPGLDIF